MNIDRQRNRKVGLKEEEEEKGRVFYVNKIENGESLKHNSPMTGPKKVEAVKKAIGMYV